VWGAVEGGGFTSSREGGQEKMSHNNLSDEINHNIAQSEIEGGVFLKDLPVGSALEVITRNTRYVIKKRAEDEYSIVGHQRYCPVETPVRIAGSTWGGSMLKAGFIGRGMCIELSTLAYPSPITTGMVKEITEI